MLKVFGIKDPLIQLNLCCQNSVGALRVFLFFFLSPIFLGVFFLWVRFVCLNVEVAQECSL